MLSHLLISKTAKKVLHKLESKPGPSRPAEGSPRLATRSGARSALRAASCLLPSPAAADARRKLLQKQGFSAGRRGLLCFDPALLLLGRPWKPGARPPAPNPGSPGPPACLPSARPAARPAGNSYRTLFLSRCDRQHGPYILVGDCICFTRV